MIIHAGDIRDPNILASLRKLAPLIAVRGYIDKGEWAGKLPKRSGWNRPGPLSTSCTT